MKFPSAVVVAIFALAGAGDAFAQMRRYDTNGYGGGGASVNLGGRYRFWTADVGGDLEAEDAGLGGTSMNLGSSLGLEDDQKLNDIGLWLPNMPLLGQMHLQYWYGRFEGSSVLAGDMNFAGTTFPSGEAINSSLGWKVWTLLWASGTQVSPVPGTGIGTGFDGQIGFKNVKLDAEIDSPSRIADGGLDAWIPIVGFSGRMMLAFFSLEIEANGARAVGIGGVDGLIYDASVSVQLQLSNFYGGVGYRWFTVDLEDSSARHTEEISLDLRVEGVFFEGGMRF